MSQIEEVVSVGKIALRENGATLASVAAKLAEAMEYEEPKKAGAPKVVKMTDDLVAALTVLPALFGKTQVAEVRQLSEDELALLGEEQDAIERIAKPLATRITAIKDSIRNHMDLVALASGRATSDTEVDAHGHYVVARKHNPEQVAIPGTSRVWSREYSSGSVTISGEKLLDMYEAGEIDRQTYLAFTRETRVFDENKAFAAMAKDPSLLSVFKKIVKRGRPSTSLYVRKLK